VRGVGGSQPGKSGKGQTGSLGIVHLAQMGQRRVDALKNRVNDWSLVLFGSKKVKFELVEGKKLARVDPDKKDGKNQGGQEEIEILRRGSWGDCQKDPPSQKRRRRGRTLIMKENIN